MTELVEMPLATSRAGAGLRLYARVASIGPVLVGGLGFVLAGVNPFHDTEGMVLVLWLFGAFLVALGLFDYRYFSVMIANCPVSIQLLPDRLTLTMPKGNRIEYRPNDSKLAFDIRRSALGVKPVSYSFQLATAGRASAQPIASDGYELLIQAARTWGLSVQEHPDKMGGPGATIIEVRAPPD